MEYYSKENLVVFRFRRRGVDEIFMIRYAEYVIQWKYKKCFTSSMFIYSDCFFQLNRFGKNKSEYVISNIIRQAVHTMIILDWKGCCSSSCVTSRRGVILLWYKNKIRNVNKQRKFRLKYVRAEVREVRALEI